LNWDTEKAKKYLIKSWSLDSNLARNYLYAWEISIKEWHVSNALKQFELAYKKDSNGKIWEKAIRSYNELIK
jgi:transposase